MKRILTDRVLLLLFMVLLVTACQSEAEKAATVRLEQARNLARGGKAESALKLLDSLQVWYSDQYRVLNMAMKLRDSIALGNHRTMIDGALEMIDSLGPKVLALSRNFKFIPGEAGQAGRYEHKRQTLQYSWNRTYLKVNVSERGEFWLTSHYFGREWLDHYCIKVYDRDLAAFSDTIGLADPWNRKVEDMGDKWETIDFREGTDGGIVDFISENQHLNLKVRFTGKRHHYIVMESFDKEAVMHGYELAQVLNEVNRLEENIERNRKALRILTTKAGTDEEPNI